jgi:hypothetical protein
VLRACASQAKAFASKEEFSYTQISPIDEISEIPEVAKLTEGDFPELGREYWDDGYDAFDSTGNGPRLEPLPYRK